MPESRDTVNQRRLARLLLHSVDALRRYFSDLLRVKDADKPKIYFQVFESASLTDLNYWLQVVLSIGIATLGLILSSPAVVIGAMLISPLMGPIFGVGLAIALGDFYLGLKSFTNVILSSFASILLAAIITWILPFHSPTPEILTRVQPTLLDLAVAVLSGLAGAIVTCRGGSGGGVTALPGVAVAVALMPPLGVVGFGIGSGWEWSIISGGGLLFLTNLVAIVLSSVVVFFIVRMDITSVRGEITAWISRQEGSDVFYELVQNTPLRRVLGNVGTLPRRIGILLLFLAGVCFPLIRTFNRIVDEANTRRIVLRNVESVIPKESLFREDVNIRPDLVQVRLVAVLPKGFSDAERQQLENKIKAQSGHNAEVSVYAVATRDELIELAERTARPAPISVETIEELQRKMWLQLEPALASVWPSDRAPLLDTSISISQGSPAIRANLVYLADEDLGELGQQVIRKNLSERTGAKLLDVSFERIPSSWTFYFRSGADSLSSKSEQDLDSLILQLRRFPKIKCVVSVPGAKTSARDTLRQRRFRGFVAVLAENQIPADRIAAGPEEIVGNSLLVRLSAPPQK